MQCITCSCTVSFYVSAVSSGQECKLASYFEDITQLSLSCPLTSCTDGSACSPQHVSVVPVYSLQAPSSLYPTLSFALSVHLVESG